MKKIKATKGKIFRRMHDGFMMGDEISLGVDHSTGVPRKDLEEYYDEVDELPIIGKCQCYTCAYDNDEIPCKDRVPAQ